VNHHKKEADELKVKNDILEYRLREQTADMQALKKEFESIKMSLSNNQVHSKKEMEILKGQN
jgi:DNA gyrase/topoisomerase IV subunit A